MVRFYIFRTIIRIVILQLYKRLLNLAGSLNASFYFKWPWLAMKVEKEPMIIILQSKTSKLHLLHKL